MSRPETNNAQELITQHLDLWSSAIAAKNTTGRGSTKKIELYGVKKLRELILEMAVRGKLVPQDPNDEPASDFLKRVEAEKRELISSGQLKKQKSLSQVSQAEVPHDVPLGWCWVRMGTLCSIIRGITFPSSEKTKEPGEGKVACLRTTNVQDVTEWDDLLYIDKKFIKRSDQNIQDNDILMSMANSRELVGKVSIVDSVLTGTATFGGFLGVIRPILASPKYLMIVLRSPRVRKELISEASQTTNIANISLSKLNPLLMGVPPVSEQHRIVAKVDELMALCDQLENQTEQSLDAHATLADTLLDALTQAQSHTELMENWTRLEQNWDILFPSTIAGLRAIDKLKRTILQLAVMGKLVPQDANDEPASELLKRIAAEKAQLVKEKKIKKQKPLPTITDEEKPFELPQGWEWFRFGECVTLKSGTSFSKEKELPSGEIPYCKVGDMNIPENQYSLRVSSRYINPTDKDINQLIPAGSIAFPKRGGAIATNKKRFVEKPIFLDLNVMAATPSKKISILYVMLWLNGVDLASLNTGTSVPQINNKDIDPLLFPCPPVAEQKRIVAKVEALTTLCDQLKQRLQTAQQTQQHFTDAVVAGALSGHSSADANISEAL